LILCRAEGGKTTQPFVAKPSILKFNCIVNIIIGNELRAIRATRDHVLTDRLHAACVVCKKDSPMLYLKNTLGGLSRSLTDSALNSFQGPHRWWKLALFAVLFVLPGGSVGMIVFAWAGHRRGQKGASSMAAPVELAGSAVAAEKVAGAVSSVGTCRTRGDAPCRAAAGKQARQASTDSRS